MERIEELYDKYIEGTITSGEKQELFDRIEKADRNDLKQLSDKYLNAKAPDDLSDLDEPTELLLQRINMQIDQREKPLIGKLWFRLSAAAAVMFMLTYLVYQYSYKNTIQSDLTVRELKDLAPGGMRATLTLAGGKTIVLDSAFAGQLALVDGTRISKTADGQLVYESDTRNTGTVQTNTISIPRGGEYKLLLPDGTKIWLNAATTISYPTRFTGQERRIKLSGEAYLEVAKDLEHPFIVETDNQTVKVLGTHFNVNTYTERTITTLEEGSVLVSSLRGSKQSLTLKPGEQAINTNTLTVEPADLESALAWKNGLLFFKDAPLATVLDEVARWYDVEIGYHTKPSQELFSGSVARNANLSAILRILKLTGVNTRLVTDGRNRKLIIEN